MARAFPQQQGVAEAARRDGADFRAEIQPVIERIGQLPTCRLDTTPIVFGQRAIARPGPGIAGGPGGHRHNRGQKPRAKPEFAIEREVQRTLRKGAQPRVPDTPILELVADRFDQSLAATAPLPLRTHRIGPEKAEATPADREIGADQLAVQLGRKARDVLGPEAAIDIVAIRPEILRIARAQESPKAAQKMRRASGRSSLVSGRIRTLDISLFIWSKPGFPFWLSDSNSCIGRTTSLCKVLVGFGPRCLQRQQKRPKLSLTIVRGEFNGDSLETASGSKGTGKTPNRGPV